MVKTNVTETLSQFIVDTKYENLPAPVVDAAKISEEAILLKLAAHDFEKIMYSNDKIVKGILSMLSQRLRKANELLNQSK